MRVAAHVGVLTLWVMGYGGRAVGQLDRGSKGDFLSLFVYFLCVKGSSFLRESGLAKSGEQPIHILPYSSGECASDEVRK